MENNGYLTRKMFYWIVGVFIALLIPVLGYMVGKQDKLSETFNHNLSAVREDISEIRVDVAELKIGQGFILEYIRRQ